MMNSNEKLQGGTMSAVTRMGNTVHRTAGPWTKTVHRLLAHLREHGITEVPEPLGFDEQGREVLSYIPGTAAITLTPDLRTDEVILSAARLLKRLHDASADMAQTGQDGWQSPAREPVEVICHGDFAPYNCVFEHGQLVGVIDFDNAHPGPCLWDIAYAVYRFSPITAPSNPENFGSIADQCRRARLFCDAYGLEDRSRLIDMVIERIACMAKSLREGASQGDTRFQANIDAGHLAIYEADIAHMQIHQDEYKSGIS